jgi:hypothetical protein
VNRLWLVTSLIVVAALLTGGCTAKPKSIEPLTDEERDRLVEIALDVPEVSEQVEKATAYKLEVKWVALVHKGLEVVDWGILTDEEAEMGIPQGFLSSFTIYPGVLVRLLSPERLQFIVAVDLDEEKVMHVEMVPINPTAGLMLPEETG